MADNLESYFKKHLSEEEPGEDNWNVPSEDVWEKVLPELQKTGGIFIPWKYVYLSAIAAVLIFLLMWYLFFQGDRRINENTTPEYNYEQPAQPGLVEGGGSDPQTITGESDGTQGGFLEGSRQPDGSSTEGPPAVASAGMDEANVRTSQGTEGQESMAPYKTVGEAQYNIKIQPPVFRLEGRSAGSAALAEDLEKVEEPAFNQPGPVEPNVVRREPLDNKGSFAAGLYFAPTFTNTFISGDAPEGTVQTGDMFLYSNNWGLELRYHLSNRFTLVTGIGRAEVKSWSESSMDFGYDSSTEHIMITGSKENTSPVPMPTPFGKVDTEITYRFPADDQIADGETMNTVFETHQELRYLSIPLGVEFNFIRFNRFAWLAEGGIQYNHALRDATSFTSRVLHQGHDMEIISEEMNTHPDYKVSYLGMYFGTGLSYQFNKRWQAGITGRYTRSITTVNLQESLSTHVQGISLKIGIFYIF